MSHDRRAGTAPAPVVALRVHGLARARAEEIYNLMSDTMHEAMDEVREMYGADMCHLVMQALVQLESEATIASAGGPS